VRPWPKPPGFEAAQWDELEAIVARAIAARSRTVQRQLTLFLILLEWLPLLRYARRLSRLDPARRANFLDRLQRAPLLLLRRGFWGVRTLILMGYYGAPPPPRRSGIGPMRAVWEVRR